MDRFSAFLLVRRGLKQRESRNLALATEAIMESLAARVGEPPEQWGVVGLLSQLDVEYSEHNPRARGRTARQQAELEGLAPELAQSLERWRQPGPTEDRTMLEHALVLAAALAEAALERGPGPALELDEALAASLGRDLELRRQSGAPDDELKDAALEQLGLSSGEAGHLAVQGLLRAAEDLR
jgi:predicted hydrolase (HD superfamily)